MLKIVILGGGKIGYYLTRTLIARKHKVTVLEKEANMCRKLANELGAEVIQGDGTDIDGLAEAGTEEADVFIAVTGKDEDNLIACQLAKKKFGVKRTISNVNNPKNIEVLEKLGVDHATSSTSIIAEAIEKEVDFDGVKMLMKLKTGNLVMNEIFIDQSSPVFGKQLKNLKIPRKCIVVSIIRGDETVIPNGETTIKDGDGLILLASENDHKVLKTYFLE
jgi:trk system potassium uptake protein TrkA